jgi:hypothetical protein
MATEPSVSFSGLDATLREVRLPMGLIVDEVVLAMAQTDVFDDPWKLVASSPGRIRAVIGEGSIQAFLEAKAPAGLSNFEVTIADGVVYVKASARVVIEIRAMATCRLEVEDGTRLNVKLAALDPGGPLKGMVEGKLEELNPLFDASQLPLPCTIESVDARDGQIVMVGTLSPPE